MINAQARSLPATSIFCALVGFCLTWAVFVLAPSAAQADVRGDLSTVALSGMAAPGVSGATFADLTWSGPAISPTGVVAFPAILKGSTTNTGIFADVSPGTLSLLVLQGQTAPGTPFQFLTGNTSVPITPSNELAASAELTNGAQGIWTGHPSADTLVAMTGINAPLPGGVRFGPVASSLSSYTPVLDWSGNVGFQTGLENSAGQTISGAAVNWLAFPGGGLAAIAEVGGQTGLNPSATFTSLGTPGLALNGLGAFSATFNDPLDGISNGSGIWTMSGGLVQRVVSTGMPAFGVTNAVFQNISERSTAFGTNMHVSLSGSAIFFATISGPGVTPGVNDHGVWLTSGPIGGISSLLVARQGDQAPGLAAGVTFSSFTDTGLGNGPSAVLAQIAGPGISASNNTGIWEGVPGSMNLIVRNGDSIADGSNTPLTVSSLTHFTMNATGELIAQLGDQSIIGANALGHLVVIARPGDSIQVAPGDFRTIQSIVTVVGGETSGSTTALNDNGLVTFTVRFNDGSTGTFVSSALAVPEPTSIALAGFGVVMLFAARRRTGKSRQMTLGRRVQWHT